uniref:Peroxidase n=1 Tax=Humulus lupulus TaxID=3486 RepID=A0A386JCK3_HUMLU|nr:peroxidase 52 [Humulus lupulus]
MSSSSSLKFVIVTLAIVLVVFTATCYADDDDLSTGFYSKSCPKVFSTVKSAVHSAISNERRIGASLLRLHFHDCFVNGCDGSILLDDTSSFTGEKTAAPNNNSVRGFGVVDKIKAKVEEVCPGVISCADILTIAARDSVVILGGPDWEVKVGRRDSKTASFNDANSGVIPPPTSTLSNLINRFQAKGLSAKDMVALSGAHTIGKARCTSFRNRIYNETNIDSSFAKSKQNKCPRTSGSGDNNLADLDVSTPNKFDNFYFKNLLNQKGLLHSDQILFNGGSTDSIVKRYSNKPSTFDEDFVKAMIKMGDIEPLTGSSGEIRKHCARPN